MDSFLLKIICIIGLLCIVNPIFCQEIHDSTIGQSNGVNQYPTEKILDKDWEQEDSLSPGMQTRACVSSYTNQTISSAVTVYGCSTLKIQDITVTSTGKLTLTAPGDITINGTFTVNAGGTLNLTYGQQPQRVISFGYDSSGNMTSQQ